MDTWSFDFHKRYLLASFLGAVAYAMCLALPITPILFPQQPSEVGISCILLDISTKKPREFKWVSQSHTAIMVMN